MTPTLNDSLAIIFYFLFWGVLAAMLECGLMLWGLLQNFHWFAIYLVAAVLSYITVWLDKYSG
jgi:hypothetical protein